MMDCGLWDTDRSNPIHTPDVKPNNNPKHESVTDFLKGQGTLVVEQVEPRPIWKEMGNSFCATLALIGIVRLSKTGPLGRQPSTMSSVSLVTSVVLVVVVTCLTERNAL